MESQKKCSFIRGLPFSFHFFGTPDVNSWKSNITLPNAEFKRQTVEVTKKCLLLLVNKEDFPIHLQYVMSSSNVRNAPLEIGCESRLNCNFCTHSLQLWTNVSNPTQSTMTACQFLTRKFHKNCRILLCTYSAFEIMSGWLLKLLTFDNWHSIKIKATII